MLNDILEHLVTGTTAASPAELTARTLDILPTEEYPDALDTALPVYIRQWLSDRRKRRNPNLPPEPESFAPDDLLADDIQVIARKLAKARGSAKTLIKMRAYLVSTSCIKNLNSPYRAVYDTRREHTATTHPDWTLGHSYNDALRIVSKALLRDMWIESKRIHEA